MENSNKPKFFQTKLVEIKGNVLEKVYPNLCFKYGNKPITMSERMESEEAICPDCGKNHWWLIPKESVAVRESGKPYIECLNCGYITHL